MLEKGKPEYATILAFDVKVDSEARNQVYMDIYIYMCVFVSVSVSAERRESDGSDPMFTSETTAKLIATAHTVHA